MHLPLPTAFTPLDAHRYLPTTAASYHPPSFLDTLHYGSGGVFSAPPLRPFASAASAAKSIGSLFVQPTPTRMMPKNGDHAAAKEDEVTSSEETKHIDRPSYSPSAFSHAYGLDRETISESAAKLLFLAVKWAKSVPSFNHISVRDQNLLIEETWAELFVITSAQYGLPIESKWWLIYTIRVCSRRCVGVIGSKHKFDDRYFQIWCPRRQMLTQRKFRVRLINWYCCAWITQRWPVWKQLFYSDQVCGVLTWNYIKEFIIQCIDF